MKKKWQKSLWLITVSLSLFLLTNNVIAQDNATIVDNETLIEITFDNGIKYTFKKSNIALEKWLNDKVYIFDNSGQKLELDYNYITSPVVASADELYDLLILYRES